MKSERQTTQAKMDKMAGMAKLRAAYLEAQKNGTIRRSAVEIINGKPVVMASA